MNDKGDSERRTREFPGLALPNEGLATALLRWSEVAWRTGGLVGLTASSLPTNDLNRQVCPRGRRRWLRATAVRAAAAWTSTSTTPAKRLLTQRKPKGLEGL